MKRRTFLSTGLALAACTTGCLGQSGTTNPTTTPKSTSTSTEPATSPTTENTKPPCEPTTTTERKPTNPPELNRTPYPAAFQWNLPNDALVDSNYPYLRLLTSADWQAKVNEDLLVPETRTFLADTDYSDESVVAYQAGVPAGLDRLLLTEVEGVGSRTLALTVERWASGSGLNNAPDHLLLVRVDNHGAEPTSADVTYRTGIED